MRLLGLVLATTLLGCTGSIGSGEPDDGTGGPQPGSDPTTFACDPAASKLTPSTIRRLPKVYYTNALRELLSSLAPATRDALIAELETRLDLIPDDIATPFTVGDERLEQEHVDAIVGVAMSTAAKVADASLPYGDGLVAPCGAGSTRADLADDACLRTVLEGLARKAFRRPPTDETIADLEAFYRRAEGEGIDGLGMVVGRLVAHPSFYYRLDDGGTRISGTEGVDAVYRLDRWELLSRLTFLFWQSPPDDALLDRVASTDLEDDAALVALADDVLADPRAERGVLSFYREWLGLESTKTPATEGNTLAGQALLAAAGVDALPGSYREDMIAEVLDLARHYTLTTDGTLADMLVSDISFARTPELAAIYGVEPWDGDPGALVRLPDGQRSGLVTRAAFVSSNSPYTHPILKGVALREHLLCREVPPPPANVEILPLTYPADRTTRQSVETATADALCQTCHGLVNPFGIATEGFDAVGKERIDEKRFADGTGNVVASLPVDASVEVTIDEDPVRVSGARELSQALADATQPASCMAVRSFELLAGRAADPVTDGCDLVAMRERMIEDGGSIKAMLRELVLSQTFRERLVK